MVNSRDTAGNTEEEKEDHYQKSTIASIIIPSMNQINLQTSECMPMLNFVDTVSETAVIHPVSISLSQKQSQDVQFNRFITSKIILI